MSIGLSVAIFIGVAVILVIVAASISAASGKKQKAIFQYALHRTGFTRPDRSDLSDNGKKGIAIDLTARKLCFYESESPTKVFKFSEITKCKLIGVPSGAPKEAGRGRVLAGHAIGTAVGGFWGGVVGGMLASRTPGRKVKRVGVKIVCNNPDEYINTILFLDIECKEDDPLYELALLEAVPWYTMLNHIIAQYARQNTSNSIKASVQESTSSKIRFYCDYCGHRIKVSIKQVGRKGKCPSCKELVIVPSSDDTDSASPRPCQEPEEQIGKCALCMEPTGDTPEKSNSGATICVNCNKLLSPISTKDTAIDYSAESKVAEPVAIEFQCEACGKKYRVSDEVGGKVGKCKKCGNLIRIPKATAVTSTESTEMEEYSKDRNIGIIAVIVTIMVIVGILVVWMSLRNDKPGTRRSARTVSRQRVDNQRQRQTFQPYEDKRFGFFSCHYPSGWKIRELDDAINHRVQFLGNEAEIRIRITKAQGNEIQSSELAEMLKSKGRDSFPSGKGTFIDETTCSVAGIPAYEMQYRQNQPRARCRIVMLYANRRLHVLMFAAPSDSLFNKWSGGFNQFLASYKLPQPEVHSLPSPPEAEVPANQQIWRSYTDPKGRFVCKVPPGWTIRETKQDPRSKVSFVGRDVEIGIITRDTGRHILDESDRRELVSMTQNLMQKVRKMGQQARLISVEWTSIGDIKGLKAETEFIKPETFWARQMKFKRDGWDHTITLTVRSLDRQKHLEMIFDQFLLEYKNQPR